MEIAENPHKIQKTAFERCFNSCKTAEATLTAPPTRNELQATSSAHYALFAGLTLSATGVLLTVATAISDIAVPTNETDVPVIPIAGAAASASLFLGGILFCGFASFLKHKNTQDQIDLMPNDSTPLTDIEAPSGNNVIR